MFMSSLAKQVEYLLTLKCPVKTLAELLSEVNVSAENRAELEDVLGMLEVHENELRGIRQKLSLRLRQYTLEYYSEQLRSRLNE